MDTVLCAADVYDPCLLRFNRCNANDFVMVSWVVAVSFAVVVVEDDLVRRWFEIYADFLNLDVQTYSGLVIYCAIRLADLTFQEPFDDAVHPSRRIVAYIHTEHSVSSSLVGDEMLGKLEEVLCVDTANSISFV